MHMLSSTSTLFLRRGSLLGVLGSRENQAKKCSSRSIKETSKLEKKNSGSIIKIYWACWGRTSRRCRKKSGSSEIWTPQQSVITYHSSMSSGNSRWQNQVKRELINTDNTLSLITLTCITNNYKIWNVICKLKWVFFFILTVCVACYTGK